MLKLVAGSPPVPRAIYPSRVTERSVRLRCVAVVQLEPDFARYLARHIRRAWPGIEIQSASLLAPLPATYCAPAQLIVCGIAPASAPVVPTLWLSELERSASVVQIYPMLWKTPTPITGRDLIRTIEWVFASSSD